MIRKKLAMLVLGLVAVTATALLPASAAMDSAGTLIVMPTRTRIIQLAFEVARVKNVGLVAYNNSPTLATPLVHVWNGHEWIQIGMDEYTSGSFMPSKIAHVFILGDRAGMPAAMTVDPAWAGTVHNTADLSIANLLNSFNEVLKFSGSEWRWLAAQNGLKLNDANTARRRYGRWGKNDVDAKAFTPGALQPTAMPPEPPVQDIKEPVLLKVPVAAPVAAPVVETPKVPETATAPVPVVEAKPEAKPVEVKAEIKPETAHLTIPAANPDETKPVELVPPSTNAPVVTVVPVATNAPVAVEATVK